METEDGRVVTTWGVFPVGETKILDGIYNPESKVLQLMFDSVTERYKDWPVQDQKTKKVLIQERKLDTYYTFNLRSEDIPFFLDNYVENNFEMDASVTSKLVTVNE